MWATRIDHPRIRGLLVDDITKKILADRKAEKRRKILLPNDFDATAWLAAFEHTARELGPWESLEFFDNRQERVAPEIATLTFCPQAAHDAVAQCFSHYIVGVYSGRDSPPKNRPCVFRTALVVTLQAMKIHSPEKYVRRVYWEEVRNRKAFQPGQSRTEE